MRTLLSLMLSFAVPMALTGCSTAGGSGSADAGAGKDTPSAIGDVALTDVPGGSDAATGSDIPVGVDPGKVVPDTAANTSTCPHVTLGPSLPAVYEGTTVGLPNWVTSPRLEWKETPDDSIAFTAPADGQYVLTLETDVESLGASAEAYTGTSKKHLYNTVDQCPKAGTIGEIDGVYNHNDADYPLELKANQTVLIWVSTPYWGKVKAGAYKLTITKK